MEERLESFSEVGGGKEVRGEVLTFHVLTIFPEMFQNFLETSIVRIARQRGVVGVHLYQLRDYTDDRHRRVDDAPYGGGPGMVFKPEPIFRAVENIFPSIDSDRLLLLLSPQGRRFDQSLACSYARKREILLICGRYEGFDERVRQGLPVEELSIGDYVLSGGELAAMVVMDAVIRLLPGVLGDSRSVEVESFSDGLLDYPQYTRPPVFRGMRVPDVLLSGNHRAIQEWRERQRVENTLRKRRDLLGEEKDLE